jgi:hypothetical protein
MLTLVGCPSAANNAAALTFVGPSIIASLYCAVTMDHRVACPI